MKHAFLIAELSHDIHTKHGCVIVDDKFRVLGMGYNGLPRGFGDNNGKRLERPEKYNWMIHSEVNAISNCVHRPENGTAIVTGICCHNCLCHLHQNGIKTIYMYDRTSNMLDEEETRLRIEIKQESFMRIYTVLQNQEIEDFRKKLVELKPSA